MVKYSRKEQIEEVYGHTPTKAFRYVPATLSLEPESHAVFPFEMMEEVIRKVKVIALVHCPCRATAQLIGKKRCDHSLENCIKYDELAEYLIEKGIGREITKQEALEVIRKSEEAGLVHLVDNATGGDQTYLQLLRLLLLVRGDDPEKEDPKGCPDGHLFSPGDGSGEMHRVRTVRGDLPGPGRSRWKAIFLSVDQEWCIGCGVCAVPCPASAVRLVRKSDAIPPKDFKESASTDFKGKKI